MNTQKPGSQNSSSQRPSSQKPKSHRNRKIAAIAAGLLVVGVGATFTLASWTDSEWVWGGADGIATSTFNIEQDTTAAFANDGWIDEESSPGGALTFAVGPTALSPGAAVYAPVALRTDPEIDSVAADVLLQAADNVDDEPVTNDPDGLLWDAIEVQVFTAKASSTPFERPAACSAAGISDPAWTLVPGVTTLGTTATGDQRLNADAASVQHYCFELTLPAGADDALQGRSIEPAWEFSATSVAP